MMKNDKNSNSYKQEMNLNMYMDAIHDTDNTELILMREKTRYTDGANKIIQKVQNEFLEKRRTEEIDLALANKDKERFMELTSENWKDAL
ncbi:MULTISPECIES: IDEAL domain-containing protein [unclassified Mesobacillus]|uniref:IDEAL domain-containing protein n=1 Tax=unclassified Mesobacillus TaxID=2675270 RepID=UPI002041E552|nr:MULTISPECIES: IDEAL domain-containing protein [unclassified Mesobacillus]MCM3124201.1 IDEAL domain-containing protein [Mesobacillus sp. MER 33]MCM3234050.1 IDEAL domain-containing protein [Mesobacillus sp. MER 48]